VAKYCLMVDMKVFYLVIRLTVLIFLLCLLGL